MPTTRETFEAITDAQGKLSFAAGRLTDARAELVDAARAIDSVERYDVHRDIAAAMDGIDRALERLTASAEDSD